ncbi:MAG TPA: V-type ATP synthase subunit F [Spirochaetia bacterium]|nr:V-type ATP synthase subunit F [Spirochaetia bacterium]
MSKVSAVVHEDLGLGFGLAGVLLVTCANNVEALEALHLLVEDRDQGIIIVEEEFLAEFEEHEREALLKRTIPLIVPIPGRLEWQGTEEIPQDDYVARLIRQAVGYQLNINL